MASDLEIPEDLRVLCPLCKGTKTVECTSFVDNEKLIMSSCHFCHAKGWLWALDQEQMAERIARAEAENKEARRLLENASQRLHEGWNTIEIIQEIDAFLNPEEKCGKSAASYIPRWGQSFACPLPKGHDGPCRAGGNCFKHGPYVMGQPGVPPQCPHFPDCVVEEKSCQ